MKMRRISLVSFVIANALFIGACGSQPQESDTDYRLLSELYGIKNAQEENFRVCLSGISQEVPSPNRMNKAGEVMGWDILVNNAVHRWLNGLRLSFPSHPVSKNVVIAENCRDGFINVVVDDKISPNNVGKTTGNTTYMPSFDLPKGSTCGRDFGALIHELGHAFGLGHSDSSTVMGSIGIMWPQLDDVEGMCELYSKAFLGHRRGHDGKSFCEVPPPAFGGVNNLLAGAGAEPIMNVADIGRITNIGEVLYVNARGRCGPYNDDAWKKDMINGGKPRHLGGATLN